MGAILFLLFLLINPIQLFVSIFLLTYIYIYTRVDILYHWLGGHPALPKQKQRSDSTIHQRYIVVIATLSLSVSLSLCLFTS